MEFKIYVADLAAYNEGRLVGEWLSLPMDEDDLREVMDRLTHNGQHDYAIQDTDCPKGVEVSEYDNPWKLNELAQKIEDLESYQSDDLELLLQACDDIDHALQVLEDGAYSIYHECRDMSDVAYELVEQTDMLHGVPESVKMYFDYEKFGRDMEINGDFTYCGNSVYVEIHN